jgi:hypothetical protein
MRRTVGRLLVVASRCCVARVRCPYCHEWISSADYPAHEAEHLKPRPDGQQSEYATLAPEEREEGSLAAVPQVYRHGKCGASTGMPEEIIRSYLKNPYLYTANATFCCGCSRHVPFRECVWEETGEDLQTYMDKLRAAKPEMKPKGCLGLVVLALGLAAVVGIACA